MKHIVCFHLYNDYSGSPKVLKDVINDFLSSGYKVYLITSKSGVLDELSSENLNFIHYHYRYSENTAVTMVRYLLIQVLTFFIAFRFIFCQNTVFYINTLLPVGPAIAGWLMNKKVIYHYHENAETKGFVYRFLSVVMQKIASHIICVSEYQRSLLKNKDRTIVIPNSLSPNFLEKLQPNIATAYKRRTVLMLSSLKLYKGALDFLRLAAMMRNVKFVLVINDEEKKINRFFSENNIQPTDNIIVYDRQPDVSSFYNEASIVVNLSNKYLFAETFGLTAIEAMSCALPVIVPTKGGISELVEDGYNGYKIDVQDLDKIKRAIGNILSDYKLYRKLANNAENYSRNFDKDKMMKAIIKIIEL